MNQIIYETKEKSIYDIKAIENNLILQCAPLIAGLKVSNLFIIQNEYVEAALNLLDHTLISYELLLTTPGKTTLLLYNQQELYSYLSEENSKAFLRARGYENMEFQQMLEVFKIRYAAYMSGRCRNFPHELGLFLGYPIEDVVGFINNSGRDCLYTGYWKVYDDLTSKVQLFHRFEDAKQKMYELVAFGFTILEVINNYKRMQKIIYELGHANI